MRLGTPYSSSIVSVGRWEVSVELGQIDGGLDGGLLVSLGCECGTMADCCD